MCRNDEVERTLVSEVTKLTDRYTDKELKTAPYLNQVIYETLRVYAAAPSALPRDVPLGGAEVDGYWIPGGTTVCIQAYSLHRDPNIFPDPGRYAKLVYNTNFLTLTTGIGSIPEDGKTLVQK